MKLSKHQRSKQRDQDLCWKVREGAHLLFCTHTLCMNFIIARFLLVSCMNESNYLLYFASFCALSTPKIKNENIKQRTLLGFITVNLLFPSITGNYDFIYLCSISESFNLFHSKLIGLENLFFLTYHN